MTSDIDRLRTIRSARMRTLRKSSLRSGAYGVALFIGLLAIAPGPAAAVDANASRGKPENPRGVTLTLGNKSGIVGRYRVVLEDTVSMSGFARAGSKIQIFMNGKIVAETTATSAGRFGKTFKLEPGTFVFTARAKAPGGAVSTSGNLRVQVAPPALLRLDALKPSEGFAITDVRFDRVYGRKVVAPAGDINCDGYADLYVNRFTNDGKIQPAAVLFGREGGFSGKIPIAALAKFGGFEIVAPKGAGPAFSAQAIHDFDGDGCSDLALHYDFETFRTPGQTVVLYGRAQGFPASVRVDALTADEAFLITGDFSVHRQTAGDFNADSLTDLALGSPYARGKGFGNDQGVTHVVFGQPRPNDGHIDLASLDGENGFRVIGVRGSNSGRALATLAGFSGNGIDDLLIGAPEGQTPGHGVQILYGRPDDFPPVVQLVAKPDEGTALGPDKGANNFGVAASSAGDFNGDGFADALIGTGEGLKDADVFLVFGRQDPPSAAVVSDLPSPATVRFSFRETREFAFASLGDVTGDGRDDIAVGMDRGSAVSGPFWTGGAVFILNGQKKPLPSSVNLAFLPPDLGTLIVGPLKPFDGEGMFGIGETVANAGDVNGDGVNDILLTVESIGRDSSPKGAIYVVYGRRPAEAAALDAR